MPKANIKDIRRRELVDATLTVLFDGGPDKATMLRIGQQVGMSHGIVNYYFKTKEDLLLAALQHSFETALEECAASIERANTPRQRLSAIVRSCFRETSFTREAASAWTAVYAQMPAHTEFARLQRSFDDRLRAMLRLQLSECVPSHNADLIAETIHALMDGIWLHRAKADSEETAATAIAKVDALIDWAIAAHHAMK
ncbi:MAG: transcriptional regulator BetI [Hyphomicrobiales bacterium]